MNINKMRDTVLQGNIATLAQNIEVLKIYSKRTGEDMSLVIKELELQIARLKLMFTTVVVI